MNEGSIRSQVFNTAPQMVALCITAISIIKVYVQAQRMTTLVDDALAVDALVFMVAAVLAFLSIRQGDSPLAGRLERWADNLYLVALLAAGFNVLFMTYGLAG